MENFDKICLLDKVFKEKTEYVKYSFDVYKKIYSLPVIKYEGFVSEELFNYVKNRKYFLLLCAYDEIGRIYLERNVQEKLYWSLPGGSIHKNEDFHTAARRIVSKINGGYEKLLLGEVEPVAFIENKFKYGDCEYTHYGIAFMTRIRNKGILETENTEGVFLHLNEKELNNINRYSNKEVARLCSNKIKNFKDKFPEIEVSTNEKYQFRYFIHNNIIKRFILTPKLKKKNDFFKLLYEKLNISRSFLDVSCGDSDVLKQLNNRHHFDYIVGNDISWSQIGFISKDNNGIIYTNHNSAHLPFKENSFDVSYCGNTLHHMSSKEEMQATLNSMFMVSKKIIIVEIEKPKDTGLIPYILNKYWYQKFLGDVGGSYLSKNDFHSILEKHFSTIANIKFSEFKNIQGRYLIAEIVKKEGVSKILEIEQKFICHNKILFEEILKNQGFIEYKKDKEIDCYYSDLMGIFIKNRTCLRIRFSKNGTEITHKGKSDYFLNSFSKIEHNIPIPNQSINNYNDLLNSLGFFKYVTVEKNRRTFIKNFDLYNCSIVIDDLADIGEFIEFEISMDSNNIKINKEDLENYLDKIIKLFLDSNLEKANLPYRDYVARHISINLLKKDKVKTILFDLDGTLIQTELLFFESFKEVIMEDYNKILTIDEYRDYEMSQNDGLIKYLIKKGLNILDKNIFMDKVYFKYNNKLEKLLKTSNISNSFNNLNLFKKSGYRIGLVTTSRKEYVDKILSTLCCEGLFEEIIVREDIINKKPDPESYKLILKKMNELPENCLVIEDSIRGFQSAQSAGINCVIVLEHSLYNKEDLSTFNVPIFNDIKQIYMLLSFVD